LFPSFRKIWSGLFIPDPGSGSWLFTHSGSRIQGSKRHRIRIRNTARDCEVPKRECHPFPVWNEEWERVFPLPM
jgi:hypothetical protein